MSHPAIFAIINLLGLFCLFSRNKTATDIAVVGIVIVYDLVCFAGGAKWLTSVIL